MIGLLRSLRSLILGETWTIPAGVAAALLGALAVRALVPHEVWISAGGFVLAGFVVAALVLALRLGR